MGSNTSSNTLLNKRKVFTNLGNIKSDYILKKVFDCLNLKSKLKSIKNNKKLQKKLNISIQDYKDYTDIIIEIIPYEKKYDNFINIFNKEDEKYFHIYFNDENEEIKRYNLNSDDNVTKIKIIINYEINSFYKLFKSCYSIKSIKFMQFKRNNIKNMSYMFGGCSSLEKIILENFNTENVTDMSWIFQNCSLLNNINLSDFKTNKVQNMSGIF